MLQIFKKSTRRTSIPSDTCSADAQSLSAVSETSSDHEFSLHDAEKFCLNNTESPVESRPKLSKLLIDILNERECLCYFVQFLEIRHALALIHFWIDAESFRSAAELCSHNGMLPKSKTISAISQSMESIDDKSSTVSDTLHESNDTDSSEPKETTNVSHRDDSNQNHLQSTIVADAIRIFKKYLVSNSINFVDIPATMLSDISLGLSDENEISSKLFVPAQQYVFEQLERNHLERFLESVFYCKYTVDVMTSDSFKLTDVLHNESILFYFMEFLEQEHVQHYLEFYLTAVNFKRDLLVHTYNKQQAQSDAMILYDKYFSLQATNPLHLSDTVRCTVEENICQENEPISNCFDLPIRIIVVFLEHNYFKPFLKSNLFFKYLSELFGKINEHKPDMNNTKKNHKRNHSEPFALKPNTLMATMDRRSSTNTSKASNMQIDSQQLNNPDILWHRKHQSHQGLSFGRVDAFGRYQREFDIHPLNHDFDQRLVTASSRIKKAVRKLVNLPEDKVQEEIAWQVAEMIVKDVTSITLDSTTVETQQNNENIT